jgi:hypothetical protein
MNNLSLVFATCIVPRKCIVICGVTLLCLTTSAKAATLTEDYSFSTTLTPSTSGSTSQFADFNPSLGTLVSISTSLSGTANYTGLGTPNDEGAYIQLETNPGMFTANCTAACAIFPTLGSNQPFTIALDLTSAAVLSAYSGAGQQDFKVLDAAGNSTDHLALTGSGTVTFNYTPTSVSATPLPAALPLYATGLGALALLRWRRKRKVQAASAA